MESYGYTTSTQEFPYKILRLEDFRTEDSTESIYTDFTNKKADGISQNLIAIKKSNLTDTQDKDIIIISAHYDTVANSYGAIDNASGVSILMEVARVLAPVPNNSNNEIHFILFSGEENHLYGSHYYVYNLSEDEKKRIIAVINLDMVGEEGPIAPVLGTHNVKENNATKLFSNYNIEIKRGTSSDHLPFHYAGIPSLTIYQYPTDMMNTIDDILKNDIVDRIDQEKLKNIADMLIQVLIENTYTVNL